MNNESCFLIPTGEKSTWKFDRPVIFLGEWCLRYEDKKIWSAMDFKVNPSYGNDQKTKDLDAIKSARIFIEIFPKLCSSLNVLHGVDYSERFWRILLGSWFEHFIDVIINRVETLQECLKIYPINEVAVFSGTPISLASPNSHSAAFLYSDDRWNHQLTMLLLDKMPELKLEKIPIREIDKLATLKSFSKSPKNFKMRLNHSIFAMYGKATSRFMRDNESVVISSFLSLKSEILLQALLRQVPKIRVGEMFCSETKVNSDLRLRLSRETKDWGSNFFESLISELLFETIPTCYLEAFNELKLSADQRSFPSSPKFIFTSNSFEYDEAFKYYSASKSESGSKIVHGQHGNNYGTHRYMNPSNEEVVCDKFLTWGWKGDLAQHTPAFILRNSGKSHPRKKKRGKLLLIETIEPIRFETWDTANQFKVYFEDQKKFVQLLDSEPKSQLLVRLASGSQWTNNSEDIQWNDFDSNIVLDDGFRNIRSLIQRSRLIIHSYDSTGLLETLSWNLPTLAFWQNGLEHLRDEVVQDFQALHEVGLLHFSATEAAQKVNEIWGDIDAWWGDHKIQNARKLFCSKYAVLNNAPLRKLNRLLRENSN